MHIQNDDVIMKMLKVQLEQAVEESGISKQVRTPKCHTVILKNKLEIYTLILSQNSL